MFISVIEQNGLDFEKDRRGPGRPGRAVRQLLQWSGTEWVRPGSGQ